jgi:hypothetical protein
MSNGLPLVEVLRAALILWGLTDRQIKDALFSIWKSIIDPVAHLGRVISGPIIGDYEFRRDQTEPSVFRINSTSS